MIISPTATDPEYRGRGYALACLGACLAQMAEPDLVHRLADRLVVIGVRFGWIGEGGAQRPLREIGTLREQRKAMRGGGRSPGYRPC